MRRGLLTWDSNELPVSTLDTRIGKIRDAMRVQNLDAFIAYTNIAKPAAVSWLCGFTPYWSEGLLYIPREGEIAFATALSKRVAEWISTVMPQGEIIPTPTPGNAIGKRLAALGAKRIAMPDLEDVPARQAQALMAEAHGLQILDGSDLFNSIRRHVDDAEVALVTTAAAIAADCMQKIKSDSASAQQLISACEGHARKSAAEEVFLSVASDLSAASQFQRADTAGALGSSFAIRISLAYKAGWVRLTQSFANDPVLTAKFSAARIAFDTLILDGSDIEAHLKTALEVASARLVNWSIEQPRGSYPLVQVAGHGMAANDYQTASPSVVNVECEIAGQRWLAARPII